MLYLYIEECAWQDQNKISAKIAVWKNKYAILTAHQYTSSELKETFRIFSTFSLVLLPQNVVHI